MTTIRKPAVAGRFYPANPTELRESVRAFLDEADTSGPAPKALIAPHAGYIYSGPIAGSAYRLIEGLRGRVSRVVLLGPAHRVPFHGLALHSAEAFATPLGSVPVDRDSVAMLARFPQVVVLDEAHAMEHSLEVHLPFLQESLGDFSLVPLAVGDATPSEVDEVLEALWGGPETLVVVSSDLSHYYDYDTARTLDEATSRAIEELRFEDIHGGDACGRVPIRGLLSLARRRNMRAETVDLRNSGDTAGPRNQVVGYGAYVFR
jgi:AmmeMemoRadiSam system protein B